MKSVAKVIFSVGVLVAATGCAMFGGGYPSGSIYNGTTVPHGVNRNETSGAGKSGDKGGEACATGILMLAAWGDASLDAAKKEAHVTEVHSVELRSFNILGIYTQGCTEVHGK
jgi:TRL-like protein family